ncbi:hypothetical protein [Pseudomonas putida]|uniref:Uncharacterized protein n=1 Tax=Pseudomonas putida TaxID=303 RepID=A0ABD7BMQ2_PSEPU|nr:hypothetical protein [Pseudomonas putida]QOD01568.1 hypothetical protein ID616_30575 [Pseudomonas putida]
MEYLITGAQLRQVQQGCPPAAVQEVLGALPRVENVSVTTDRTRRDEVSVGSALALALPRLFNVRSGSWFARACSGIYSFLSGIGGHLYIIGLVYGCVWGYDYIQSQWNSGLSAGMVATIVALSYVALQVAASVIYLIKVLAEKDNLGEVEVYTPFSGHMITELQIQGVLDSSPPGYVIKMLDSLPVMACFEKSKTLPEETEVEVSAIEPKSVAPEPPGWWKLPVKMIIHLSLLWLAFGHLSADPDSLATIGGYALVATSLNSFVCLFWARRSDQLIARRTSLTW